MTYLVERDQGGIPDELGLVAEMSVEVSGQLKCGRSGLPLAYLGPNIPGIGDSWLDSHPVLSLAEDEARGVTCQQTEPGRFSRVLLNSDQHDLYSADNPPAPQCQS